MAILALLVAFGSRFVGKILSTTLGWAGTLLIGRMPASRQYQVVAINFGSVIWLALVAGILFPDVGVFLLLLIPDQDLVPESVVRLVMLVGALFVPAVVGVLAMLLAGSPVRTGRPFVTAAARGYPLTAVLALLLIFLGGLAVARKASGLARRWTDAHVPLVVMAGRYDEFAADLAAAVQSAGLEVTAVEAPAYLSRPARWLAAVAGPGAASLVPQRLIRLDGRELDILIYPMDVLISGKPHAVARARAAMASRLTTSAAHLTVSAEAQAIEDRLMGLMQRGDPRRPGRPQPFDDHAAAEFTSIDQVLATIMIPYEEWEVLCRRRLQVERDLRVGST